MAYYGSWKIDDVLTFHVQTTRFDTGAATDADSVPTYRVYEDETATPLLTGSMATLDATNTDGFYSEAITLSAANGFEKGKSYAIHIKATVNSVAAATFHNFQMEAEVDANVVSDKTGYALSAAGVDAVWDEPLAAHTTADTPGQVVNMLTQDTVTLSTDVALGSIVGQMLDNGTAWSYDRTTDSQEAIRDKEADIETDTQDIQARLPAALTAGGNMKADALAWAGAATATDDIALKATLAKGTDITGFNDLSAAQVNTEVDTAIADARLDELLAADSDIDGAAPPTVGSVFHELMSKTAGSFTFDQTTDSLEAVRDKLTDIETDTAEIGVAGAGLSNIGTVATVTNLTNAPTNGDLTAAMKASVNAEVVDCLNVDTYPEPGQETPPATTTLVKKIGHTYKGYRNKKTATSTLGQVFSDAGVVDQKFTISDDGTTYTEEEMVSGP